MHMSDKNKDRLSILFIILLSAIPFSLAFSKSVWLDEAFSLRWSVLAFEEMMQRLINDVHPPLYYFLLRVVQLLTGNSLFAAKLLSILPLVLLFVIGFCFVSKEFGYKSMIFFDLFLLCAPMMLKKSVEIRMYTWAYLFVVISSMQMYFLLGENVKKRNWIFFTLSSLAAAYTHYFALLAMVVIYAGIFIYAVFSKDWKRMKDWLICAVITAGGYFPWLPIAINQIKQGGASWIEMPSSRLGLIRELFTTTMSWTENVYLFLLVAFVIFGLACLWKYRDYKSYWALVCMSVVWFELVFGLAYGTISRPIMISRYLMIALCAGILGMSFLCKYISKYIVIGLCVLFVMTGGVVYPTVYEEEYGTMTEETLAFAEEHIQAGDIVLYDDGSLTTVIPYFFPDVLTDTVDVYSQDYEYLWYFDVCQTLDFGRLKERGIQCIDYGLFGFDVEFHIFYLYQN